MKKNVITITLVLISALFITTNCAKEEASLGYEDVTSKAVPFKLNVNVPETRTTTTNGTTINWTEGDALNVFHAASGSSAYGSNDKFTLSEGTSFTGELADGALDETKSYNWYVLYPYNNHITTPANTSGYIYIGSSGKSVAQVQAGNDNKAHLAGQYFPLYGKATGVAANNTPTITLNQALAVVKVHVTNTNDVPLTVENVSFTGTEDIIGSYIIDFAGDTPTFTASGDNYVSNTAKLTVSGGSAINKNGSADFYIAIKPFTADGTLTVSVNGLAQNYVVSNKAFSPGKIKTVNFNYVTKTASLDFAIDGASGYAAYSTVDGMSSNGVESDYAATNSPYLAKFDNTNDYVQVHFNEAAGKASIGVKMIGGATTSYFNVMGSADGTTFTQIQQLTIAGAANTVLNLSTSEDIDATYRYIRFVFVKGANVGVGPISIFKPSSDPVIEAEDITNVPAIGIEGTASYTIKNFSDDDVKATCDGTVVTSASASSGTITYTVAPNYSSSLATGSITLTSESTSASKTITVSQNGETVSVSSMTVTIPKGSNSATFTLSSASFDWNSSLNPVDGKSFTINPSEGTANQSAQTITVSSEEISADKEQTLGTIVIYRNANTADPQKKTITVKKASSEDILYSTGFESDEGFKAGSIYQATVTQGPEGKQWETYYGTVSTSNKINGENSLALRLYKTDNYAYSKMLFDVGGTFNKVSFKAKASTANSASIKLTIEYSTNSGTTWTVVEGFAAEALTSSAASYSFSVTGNPSKYRLRFSIDESSTKPSSGNAQLTIDDIKFVKE